MTNCVKNPILPGFYPDPSICRVGGDFYLITSTFAFFPGLPIFHSTDLAHWEQIGNGIHRQEQLNFTGHSVSKGLFAPTIRFHDGLFYIICTLVDTGGNFIITAVDPAGPWSDPAWISSAGGIDPSLFFDDDGSVWYTGTRPIKPEPQYNGNWEVWTQQLDISRIKEGKVDFVGEGTSIWSGALKKCIWPEGPHMYKINGTYYLMAAEGGTAIDHAECVARADSPHGPWVGKPANPLLTHRHLGESAEIINVGHADLVDAIDGSWYLVCLATRPFGECVVGNTANSAGRSSILGRETFLVPVIWEHGWPVASPGSGLIQNDVLISCFAPNSIAPEKNLCAVTAKDSFEKGLPLHWLTLRNSLAHTPSLIKVNDGKGILSLSAGGAVLSNVEPVSFAARRLMHKKWNVSSVIEFAPENAETAGVTVFREETHHIRFELCLFGTNGEYGLRIVSVYNGESTVVLSVVLDSKIFIKGRPVLLSIAGEDLSLSCSVAPADDNGKPCGKAITITRKCSYANLGTEFINGAFTGTLVGVFASGGSVEHFAHVLNFSYSGE